MQDRQLMEGLNRPRFESKCNPQCQVAQVLAALVQAFRIVLTAVVQATVTLNEAVGSPGMDIVDFVDAFKKNQKIRQGDLNAEVNRYNRCKLKTQIVVCQLDAKSSLLTWMHISNHT